MSMGITIAWYTVAYWKKAKDLELMAKHVMYASSNFQSSLIIITSGAVFVQEEEWTFVRIVSKILLPIYLDYYFHVM